MWRSWESGPTMTLSRGEIQVCTLLVHSLGESQAAPTGPSLGTISSDSPMKLGADKRKEDFLIDHLFCITFPLCWKSEYSLGACKEIWLWEYGWYLNEELSCSGICGSVQIAVKYKTFCICTCTYTGSFKTQTHFKPNFEKYFGEKKKWKCSYQ